MKFWGGHPQPWRNGTDDSELTDLAIIVEEEGKKSQAEAEDAARAPTTAEHADMLSNLGISVKFLLLLTHELNLWEWKTWEVVQFLVKPATEVQGRCRFADLECIRPFTGPATVFASHCWGAQFGDLVVALCAGGDTRRMVWIDIFAVNFTKLRFDPIFKFLLISPR